MKVCGAYLSLLNVESVDRTGHLKVKSSCCRYNKLSAFIS